MNTSRPKARDSHFNKVTIGLNTLFFILSLFSFLLISSTLTETGLAQRQESESESRVESKSVVTGRVIYDDTRRPVRRAKLMFFGAGFTERPTLTTATDENGLFRLEKVPAGSYFVMVDAPGIVTPYAYMNFTADGPPTEIFTGEIESNFTKVSVNGTDKVEVEVRAKRGGAISGKVTYADGDPAINVRIGIGRKQEERTSRFLTNFNPASLFSMRTDDRGMYRIAGLPPGEYFVSATEENTNPDQSNRNPEREVLLVFDTLFMNDALAINYYGGASSLRGATAVRVDMGSEVSDINITIVERKFYRISGVVTTRRDGRPLPKATVNIRNKEELIGLMESGRDVTTDEQGRWSFSNVPDGAYIITVSPVSQFYEPEVEITANSQELNRTVQQSKRRLVPKQQEIVVAGGDILGLPIELTEGAKLSGKVTVEGNKPLPEQMMISVESVDSKLPDQAQGNLMAGLGADSGGSFTIEGIPGGKIFLNLSFYPEAISKKYYVKSILASGVDMMREPLNVTEGAEIKNVRITLSTDVATLKARILSSVDNNPLPAKQILLVPAEPARWRFPGSYLFGMTDAEGFLTVSGAPGEYLVILPGASQQQQYKSAEDYIKSRAASAKRITLQPNENKQTDIVVTVTK